MDWIRGAFTALPHIMGSSASCSRVVVDDMLASGKTLNVARKLPVIAGLWECPLSPLPTTSTATGW